MKHKRESSKKKDDEGDFNTESIHLVNSYPHLVPPLRTTTKNKKKQVQCPYKWCPCLVMCPLIDFMSVVCLNGFKYASVYFFHVLSNKEIKEIVSSQKYIF